MTADLINLRQARKRRARSARAEAADGNRVLHGLSKVERTAGLAERSMAERRLDGHALTAPDEIDPQNRS